MQFYENFADRYDSLVSFTNRKKREKEFWLKLFKENKVKRILDCACGTGHHVIMFKQFGYDAFGSDQSPAMIAKAKENGKKEGLNLNLEILDFLKLSSFFQEKFDTVVCVGNSLPHLQAEGDLLVALTEMNLVLSDGGLLVLAIRNYDKMLGERRRFMPVSFQGTHGFIYVFDYFPDKITFNVIYVDCSANTFEVYATDYFPLEFEKLQDLLKTSNFSVVSIYQDFDLSAFNLKTSDHIILVCRKHSYGSNLG